MVQLQNDELFDILVGKISATINRTFLRTFTAEGIDISIEQWTVLACLWNKDKVTQQTLCSLTAKDKPSSLRFWRPPLYQLSYTRMGGKSALRADFPVYLF